MLLDFSWSNSASRSITKSTRRSQATGMDAVVFPLVSKRNQPYPSCRADEKKRGLGRAQGRIAQKPAHFLGRQFSNARRPGNGSSAKIACLWPVSLFRQVCLPGIDSASPACGVIDPDEAPQATPTRYTGAIPTRRSTPIFQYSNTPSLRATGFEDEDEAPGERAHSQRP